MLCQHCTTIYSAHAAPHSPPNSAADPSDKALFWTDPLRFVAGTTLPLLLTTQQSLTTQIAAYNYAFLTFLFLLRRDQLTKLHAPLLRPFSQSPQSLLKQTPRS